MKAQKRNLWSKMQKFFLHPVSQMLPQTLEKKESKGSGNPGIEVTSGEFNGREEED